ncbi:kinesin-like protein KIF16B isoform X6 [Coregonus clupeaformis]|uniref:kinesin-like protein KIF16B isoform X6 n=1 Tax=Coregonus clupeaformis TaxID=59861 RepID=UPI001E1C4390|nr:kinesin-like protein KIF16B isoform X6 [Coregonus clupeaformis]
MASVRVAVRLRPMNRREKDLTAKNIIEIKGDKTTIANLKIPDGITGDSMRERKKTFTYDFSYDSSDSKSNTFVSQEKVFKDLGSDVLKAAFQGYNACIFAYGQTGSGKSYTMMGNPGDAGLIPRICEGLFSRIAGMTRWDEASFRTEVSYLEIYNERVRDLLRRKSTQTYNLRVREHPKDGPYVEDLSKHLVQNYHDVEELMEAGNINRTTAATGMNDTSSRSHAIFTINFTQAKFDAEMPCETISKIHLVDLAGSERADTTGATGVRLKEGGNINKSLVTLGNVISALADLSPDGVNTNLKKKQVFVPYRDSVLTWLLKDSLGGNSKTIMIATISPADVNYGETLSTLRYANRAKNIINKPTINEDCNVKLIRELRAEIARLKALLVQGNQIALLDSPTALSMEEKLHQNEARVLELTKEWTNKWNETQNILKEETLALRKEGIGVVLDSELPHLIGIDDDLLSTGIILYHLKEGRTYVGRDDASTVQDIVLHGLDLESEHCMFANQTGTVTLVPLNGAQCSVNGVQVTEASPLNQGAVILLGRTNMFRFNHPKEAAKLREKRKSGLLSSFSLSMTDLNKSCENLSTVMLYNPGLEFERQQREELEKLEHKRRLIKEMEERQKCEKAELELLQQEVESQRKESEQVQQRIRHQEETLRCRSQDIESRLRDLLAEKQRFEEERHRETQEPELQRRQRQKQQQEEREDEKTQDEEARRHSEAAERAEQAEVFRELERLKREHVEQGVRLEAERRRLEEREMEQLGLVGRLEEQLRERHEAAAALLTREDTRRLDEERRALAEIREALLRAKETSGRSDCNGMGEEAGRAAQVRYTDFKAAQVEELGQLEEGLRQQKECLEKEVASERAALALLVHTHKEHQRQLRETQEKGAQDASELSQEEQRMHQAEQRLLFKERRLASLTDSLLPAVAEERQRAEELLKLGCFSGAGSISNISLGLDNTLYQVEKELEEKEERLTSHCASAEQLQQLQETYEFTANVARQEEKVRRKEKEILESREKQQHEALEQAVARLERRHSALKSSVSLDPESEESRRKASILGPARELDHERVEREIQKLKQRISKTEGSGRNHTGSGDEKTGLSTPPVSPIQSLPPVLPIADDGYSAFRKINAYIEEEVKRRLQKLNLLNGDKNIELALSSESPQEDKEVNESSSVRLTDEDDDKLQNRVNSRKLKYEKDSMPLLWRSFLYVPGLETSTHLEGHTTSSEEGSGKDHSELDKIGNPERETKVLPEKDIMPYKEGEKAKWWQVGVKGKVDQAESENNGCEFKTKDWRFRSTNTIASEDGNNSQCRPDEEETNLSCYIVDDKTKSLSYSQSRETRTENPLLHTLSQFDSVEGTKDQVQNTSKTSNDTATVINSEVPILRLSSKRQITIKGYFGLNKIPKESVNGQVQSNLVTSEPDLLTNELGAKQSYVLGYLAGKLSGVYNDAGRYLQSTRDIIRQVRAGETSALNSTFSQYMTIVTKDLPLVQKKQLEPSMKPDSRQNKVHFANLTGNCLLNVPEKGNVSATPDISLWPKGSVTTYKDGKPVVYCQTLVEFPKCLSELQSLPLQKMMHRLYCVTPKIAASSHHLLGIYWLSIANCKQPTPQPSCLLLSETDLYAVSAGTGLGNNQPLAVFHHFSLLHIKEIQVSFAGQHVRLLGSTEDTILVIFTHSKALTQELCCTLLKILAPAEVQEGPGAYPLLRGDLLRLSLDWRSHVPDLLLDSGLCVTSRFKRVMADLLYILHGNMEGPNRPSLANIHLLLYTSIKVENYSTSRQVVLCQFFLTDNHIGLVQEDAVFHPVPRGSTLVPIQPQFRGVELRRRSDIRCVLVRHSDRCMVLDILFSMTHKGQIETKRKTRKGLAIVPPPSDCRPPADSWKLTFSSTSDAAILINHLST